MFRQVATRVGRNAVQQQRRGLKMAHAEPVPVPGYGQLQKEPNFMKTWVNVKSNPEIIPIIGIVSFACSFAAYKVFVVDAGAPDTHFSPYERGTLDYVENNRDPASAIAWGKTGFHQGPFRK